MSKNVIEITRVAMIWRMEIKVLTLELNSLFCYNISNRLLFLHNYDGSTVLTIII